MADQKTPVRSDRPAFRGARPLADVVARALEPACRKRGFTTADLISHWPDVVGPTYAENTAPDRLAWPRRPHGIGDDDGEPATLTVRCSGAVALRLNHELPQVIERINMFFGYRAVGRIRVLQLPIARVERRRRPTLGPVSPAAAAKVATMAAGIGDDGLRAALERLGTAVMAQAGRPITKT